MLGVFGRMTGNELERAMRFYCQNRADISAKWMRVSVRLRRVEEENVVRVGDERFMPVLPTKYTATDEDDAVSRVRLFRSVGCTMRVAVEIDDGNVERFN
jgi:hypothetical protein